jgi:hypothetical protein
MIMWSNPARLSELPDEVDRTGIKIAVANISDGLMRLDSARSRSVFATAYFYFLPLLGQAVMAAAAMLLNSAGVAPSRAWIAIPWKTLR